MARHRSTHETWLRATVVVLGLSLLASCAPADLSDSPPDTSPSVLGAEGEVTPESDATAPEPPALPTPCPAPDTQEIQDTIRAQSMALAEEDFATAYTFASPSFRDSVSLEQFERVITRQYDMLLTFQSARFGRCDVDGTGRASVSVEVRSAGYPPVTMRYEMVNGDQWRVSAVDTPVSSQPNV